MPRILIIDCFDSFTYNIFHYLDELNSGNCAVVRYDKLNPEALSDYTHLVISPGPGLPDEYPKIQAALNQIEPNKVVLGVCLGLQCIVEHFGGKLEQLGSVQHGLESMLIFNAKSLLFRDLKSPLKIGHYHSWVASEKGFPNDVLNISSRNEAGLIMSIEHRTRPIFAVQFHPESVMTENGKLMLKNWLEGTKSS
jgi:anthranilate synthase component 2